MIIPCIDLMDRKVVQLVQGREKRLELPDPLGVLGRFIEYPEIQVIDLDAAIGGPNSSRNAEVIRELCARKSCRVGGGIRTVERAAQVVTDGASKVIVGSSAFTGGGINHDFLRTLAVSIPRKRVMIAVDSLGGQVAIHGWRTVLPVNATDAIAQLEPYCSEFLSTYIDAEGKLQGTSLDYFRNLRAVTNLPITAAGGITTDEEIAALDALGMNAALGMAIYRKVFPELFME
jgi:phosphoribosylformimino-5-aminoimidazole carboxamide ribonucleotide (ProFAR) isomerase